MYAFASSIVADDARIQLISQGEREKEKLAALFQLYFEQ